MARSHRGRRWFFVVVLLLTLVAGLNPRDYRFHNEVDWLETGPGIRFGQYGRIHSGDLLDPSRIAALNASGFTLEIAAAARRNIPPNFGELVCFHGGEEATQLILGQWKDSVIAMNGNDYSHRRHEPRVSADTTPFLPGPVFWTLSTGPKGTWISLNGKRVDTRLNLQLKIPSNPHPARLTFGSSASASGAWQGTLHGFALYPGPLAPSNGVQHFRAWKESGTFAFATNSAPLLLYLFDERRGERVQDHGSLGLPLIIPSRLISLEHRVLTSLPPLRNLSRGMKQDVALNLIGFMPLGFALCLVMHGAFHRPWWRVTIATVLCVAVSFLIEFLQAWMPSRDSSLLDLALNTAGGAAGALCQTLATWRSRR